MTLSPTARGAVAVSCAAALLLTGCSGGGDDKADKGGESPADEWTPGPLDEYMAKIYGYSTEQDEQSQEQMQAESDRQMREVEELVASCMQDQGFDYTAVTDFGVTYSADDELDVEWGSREFAEKYGYGLSTDPWNSEEQASDDEVPEDPNADYVSAMSESERTAYEEALYGVPVTDETAEYDWTTAGCYGAAQHEVYEAPTASDQFTQLEEQVNAYWEAVQADPRMAELNASWASCMADAGFDGLTDPNATQSAIGEEWNALQGWEDPEFQALAESWDYEAEPDGPPMPTPDAAVTEEFTKREIATAVADYDCVQETDYLTTSTEIDHAAQQDFVDQHKAELEAWVEAAATERGK